MFTVMTDPSQTDRGVSRPFKKLLFGAGLIVYVGGLYLLTYANAMADNWAGLVSPLCIIGGLVTIFISLILRPEEVEKNDRESQG